MSLPRETPDYALQQRVFEGLEEAQRQYRERTGARLVVLPWPPYFRYVNEEPPSSERKAS
jgi:hypothetical protein